jgi:RES domain-containing protein
LLDGEGARKYGGRWNSPGTAVVYLSATASLAALEYLVHVDPEEAPSDLVILEVVLPLDVPVARWSVGELPANWRSVIPSAASQSMGDAWISAGTALAVSVPSVVLPSEWNLLLNPAHAAMSAVEVVSITPFQFDPRLIG